MYRYEPEQRHLQYFESLTGPMMEQITDRFGFFLSEEALDSVLASAIQRIHRYSRGWFIHIAVELLKDEDPLLEFDPEAITKEEREEASGLILEKLQNGELVLPDRLSSIISAIMERYEDSRIWMLEDLYENRRDISQAIGLAKPYEKLLQISPAGDPHNGGRQTCVIVSDQGKFVYKAHSCQIDRAVYELNQNWFGDSVLIPRVYAGEDRFGVTEFLEKKIVHTEEDARRYYHSLGETAAMIKVLGTRDMHVENLFGVGTRIAIIDLETVLCPPMKIVVSNYAEQYSEEEQRQLDQSLVLSGFVFGVVDKRQYSILFCPDEIGSCPVIGGKVMTLREFYPEFEAGFIDGYRRCMNGREKLKEEIERLFRGAQIRYVPASTRTFADITARLSSVYSYQSEEYYLQQIEKMPSILQKFTANWTDRIIRLETDALFSGDIPYFWCEADGRNLKDTEGVVQEDFLPVSPADRALSILDHLSENDCCFQLDYVKAIMNTMRIPADVPARNLTLAETALSREEAVKEAEESFEKIYEKAMRLDDGVGLWLEAKEEDHLWPMMAGLYCGTAGMALAAAAVLKISKQSSVYEKADEIFAMEMTKLRRMISVLKEKEQSESVMPLGETGGIAGILNALVILSRMFPERASDVLEEAVEYVITIRPEIYRHPGKGSGITGLITVLCRYEELYSRSDIKDLIRRLADRLMELKTMEYEGIVLWKTMKDRPYPISGNVHGLIGVAEALFLAWDLLGEDRWYAGAMEAYRFENRAYSPELKTWPDLRHPGSSVIMQGNCYGASGFGIIFHRLKERGIVPKEIRRNISRARQAWNGTMAAMDHLCCGNLSDTEYLIITGETEEAGRILQAMVTRKKKTGRYWFGEIDNKPVDDVSLFFGLAGIVYEMMRYAYPQEIPSVV